MAGAWQVWAHPRSRSLRTGGAPSIEEPLIRTKLLSVVDCFFVKLASNRDAPLGSNFVAVTTGLDAGLDEGK